jgi:hypothetical protein
MRERVAGAHRVLKASGEVSPNALGAPSEVRRRLEAEGLEFVDGKAIATARLRSPALT